MTTADMVRSQIRARAYRFAPVREKADRKLTAEQRRTRSLRESWARHLEAWVTPYRDLP